MKIEATKIKSWVERIERLLAERAGINGDIRDIYTEIKTGDHDAKAIRKLIQRRAMDPADLVLQDDLLSAYTDAIAGKIRALDAIANGASTREAAKAGGISTGAAAAIASAQKSRNLSTPTDEHPKPELAAPLDCHPQSVSLGGEGPTPVADEELDLALPPTLAAKRKEIEARRAGA